ncbi:hypothetical protein CBM2626_U20053 [Cupriavidus taiwanensis]|uniref:Uncharacterized protein n=1 Tax=Cupriavidus taiwanensis TaxID=164546 RepID=A0A375FK56_9BURK|nr:hypothetical protein CBM2614_U10121 [Cupriavidus taiwanensis]SOZ73438.1 hypothetical protein CBM2615_U10115 [Cupriavidus taiwanensis]SOZ75099.1 hypothetical protein CBM2613_U10001 [Cupriavidus taiwanensis]SPA03837.1 hypothetical protein CBM2626_U20053 [Cupriavidus taiwanensis]SPA11699.1 protein of unknown function [Cupriavidus taiwanensis]
MHAPDADEIATGPLGPWWSAGAATLPASLGGYCRREAWRQSPGLTRQRAAIAPCGTVNAAGVPLSRNSKLTGGRWLPPSTRPAPSAGGACSAG